MNAQMIRVISSPSSSTIGFLTLIFAMRRRCYRRAAGAVGRPVAIPAQNGAMATVERPHRRRAPTRSPTRPPPLVDYNVFEADRSLVEAVAPRGRGLGRGPDLARSASSPGSRPADRAGPLRPTRTRRSCAPTTATATASTRSSSTPPGTSCSAPRSPTSCTRCPGASRSPGAHVARGAAFMCFGQAEAGVGCPISMTYSVIPALRHQPELAEEWEPRFISDAYDPAQRARDREAGRAGRHGDDREAGRLRRARQHHGRPAAERRRPRRRVRAHRPQVVHVGADVRRVPGPRPGRRRHLLLPVPALDARRRAQQLPPPAAQGQARQPLQRLQRDRVRRRLGAAGRRGGRRRADDHRDGQPHPARLRRSARPAGCGPASPRRSTTPQHRATFGKIADRPAADAERARRPRDRVRGGDDLGDAAGARLRRGDRRRRRGRRPSSGSPTPCSSTGSASAAPRTRSSASSASAATATSRSRACRASTARPAALDLGGLGQRPVPRRAAGDGQEPRLGRGLLRRGRRGRGPSRGSTPTSPSCARSSATWPRSRPAPAASSSAWRWLLQGSLLVRFGDEAVADAFCASRLDGDWGQAFGTLPAGTDFTRIIDRHAVSGDEAPIKKRRLAAATDVAPLSPRLMAKPPATARGSATRARGPP